jgi:hypothetical protein
MCNVPYCMAITTTKKARIHVRWQLHRAICKLFSVLVVKSMESNESGVLHRVFCKRTCIALSSTLIGESMESNESGMLHRVSCERICFDRRKHGKQRTWCAS